MMNKDKKQIIMSFIGDKSVSEIAIKDKIEDNMSFIEVTTLISPTWTLTWTKCPSSLSSQNLAKLARFWNHYIDTNIDSVSMYNSRRTFTRTLCPSKLTTNTWTLAWTKCLSLKN